MTRNPSWCTWLVLILCAVMSAFLTGASSAQADDDDDDDSRYHRDYGDQGEDDDDEGRYGEWDDGAWEDAPNGGRGHGGAGATQVPIVDDDFEFMVAWTRDHLQAGAANAHATGAGVVVAVLDGGFNLSHPDVAANTPFGYDAVDRDSDPEDLGNGLDDDRDGLVDEGVGHGTFVAGMVLLAAPDATILPVRVRDDEGWGLDHELRRGLQWAWDHGADIVTIAGTADARSSSRLMRLVRDMRAAGVAVVVSAGNQGVTAMDPLAEEKSTLAVASTDENDRLASWSNASDVSPTAVVMAPGVGLYGALGGPDDSSSGYWSGTSFSAGLVGGAAALVLESRPGMDPYDLYGHLLATADPAYDEKGAPLQSSGRINLRRATQN